MKHANQSQQIMNEPSLNSVTQAVLKLVSGLFCVSTKILCANSVRKEGNVLFNDAHFIFGYMVSDIW